jgi:hypothetical protein
MDKPLSKATADSARLPGDKQAEIKIPDYSPGEIQYLGSLQKLLEISRNLRDTNYDEYELRLRRFARGMPTVITIRPAMPYDALVEALPRCSDRRIASGREDLHE